MLVDIDISVPTDEITAMIAQINGQNPSLSPVVFEGTDKKGYYHSPFNFDNIVGDIVGRLTFEQGYPNFDTEEYFGSYGVCDSPEQFIKKFHNILESDEREFVVGFAHVTKDPSNAGNGGGWRWHKWGAYVGEGEPTCEYLDDEALFHDGVYCYKVVQVN